MFERIMKYAATPLALAAGLLVWSTPRPAAAQTVLQTDVYKVAYFDHSVTGGAVRFANPTTRGGSGPNSSELCAMIYVFDNSENELDCCGCPVTNEGLRTLGEFSDLTQFSVSNSFPTTGVIKVVSALPNVLNSSIPPLGPVPPPNQAPNYWPCNPAAPASGFGGFNEQFVLTPTLRGWITHGHASSAATGITEVEFEDAPLDAGELNLLESGCATIHTNGTGRGLCTCGSGDNVAN